MRCIRQLVVPHQGPITNCNNSLVQSTYWMLNISLLTPIHWLFSAQEDEVQLGMLQPAPISITASRECQLGVCVDGFG